MQRRQFLRHAGTTLALASTGALTACAQLPSARNGNGIVPAARLGSGLPELAPVKARTDRITGVYVCTRPFRAAGPRIEMERMGNKAVVHNYGHGGSGWSLSWGSSTLALRMAQTTGVRELGVIGCGALGLTSALLAQRAGLSVRIYAKDLPPNVYSMRASGLWTPDSRICDAEHAPALATRWEEMTRTSFAQYQSMLGLPGNPIEWIEGYHLSDTPPDQQSSEPSDEPEYGELYDHVRDLTPRSVALPAGSTPFPQAYVRRYTTLMFNISTYARMLMSDFLVAGGKIEVREFHQPEDLQQLPERTLINATGCGHRNGRCAMFSARHSGSALERCVPPGAAVTVMVIKLHRPARRAAARAGPARTHRPARARTPWPGHRCCCRPGPGEVPSASPGTCRPG